MTSFRTISRQLAWLRDVQHGQEGCIIWPYGVNPGSGYPMYRHDSVTKYATVTACEWEHGPRPEGMEAAHECGVRRCVNQKHLRWKTPVDNMLDQKRHGTWPAGEANGRAKLTQLDVDAIRASGERSVVLAEKFSVTRQTISAIRSGKRWGVES